MKQNKYLIVKKTICNCDHYIVQKECKFLFWTYMKTLGDGPDAYDYEYHFASEEAAEKWIDNGCKPDDYYGNRKEVVKVIYKTNC